MVVGVEIPAFAGMTSPQVEGVEIPAFAGMTSPLVVGVEIPAFAGMTSAARPTITRGGVHAAGFSAYRTVVC